MIPTLFGMWLLPNQAVILQVDNGACPHLINGADLMAPGLRCSLDDLPEFGEDEPVGIAIPCGKFVFFIHQLQIIHFYFYFMHRVIAIGYTLISSDQLKQRGKTGKIVQVEHTLGDHLFVHA